MQHMQMDRAVLPGVLGHPLRNAYVQCRAKQTVISETVKQVFPDINTDTNFNHITSWNLNISSFLVFIHSKFQSLFPVSCQTVKL
jgi:hypothetical protein